MAEVQHVFGEQVDGQTYHARRAVYAVIRDSEADFSVSLSGMPSTQGNPYEDYESA